MGSKRKHSTIEESEQIDTVVVETSKKATGEAWRKTHGITVLGNNNYDIPEPILTFDQTPFCTEALVKAGFSAPTLTQSQSWPIALSKRDLISVAKTGSGKTLGFLLPSFHHLDRASVGQRGAAPQILVLCPTRELATQIQDEAVKFGKSSKLRIRSTCCYGGSPKSIQIRSLQAGTEVLIATPGRLNDLYQMGKVNLSKIKTLVLDEADRMLDMGFEPQIRSIIDVIPTGRQTLLFSATWPKSIQRLASEFLTKPIQVNMGEINVLHANKDITQHVTFVDESGKGDALSKLIKSLVVRPVDVETGFSEPQHPKTIIFFRTKRACERLANEYWDLGYVADALHGDKEQWQRTKVMNDFKAGRTKLLFATDVAARGLDVSDVGVVINYDMPDGRNGIEDYVHRIGRTGRAGKKGLSHSFFTSGDAACAPKLVNILKSAGQDIPDELYSFGKRGGGRKQGGGRGRFNNNRGRGRRW